MLLTTPDKPPPTHWEGALEPVPATGEPRVLGEGSSDRIRTLPVLSIHTPQVWTLDEFYAPASVPPTVQARAQQHDYYVARLACSFRVSPRDTKIDWARFLVSLSPDAAGRQPTVFDLHPLDVSDAQEREVNFALQPSLKFGPAEVGTGEIGVGVRYTKLEPLITAAISDTEPSWDFEATRGIELRGTRWMHLVIQAPQGMPSAEASLDLTADLIHGGVRLPAVLRRPKVKDAPELRARLWG